MKSPEAVSCLKLRSEVREGTRGSILGVPWITGNILLNRGTTVGKGGKEMALRRGWLMESSDPRKGWLCLKGSRS